MRPHATAHLIIALLLSATLPTGGSGAPPVEDIALSLHRVRDHDAMRFDPGQPHAAALRILRAETGDAAWEILTPLDVRQSATGIHVRFAAQHDGRSILGAAAAVHYRHDGTPWLLSAHVPAAPPPVAHAAFPGDPALIDVLVQSEGNIDVFGRSIPPSALARASVPEEVWHHKDGTYHAAFHAIVHAPGGDGPAATAGWDVLVHPHARHLDEAAPRWRHYEGRIFALNPIVFSGNPDLRDDPGGQETPELAALAQVVRLERLHVTPREPQTLTGQWVRIETETSSSRSDFRFPRSDIRFEDVMSYHHIDQAQSLVQSLGFPDANNRAQVVTAPLWDMYNAYYAWDEDGGYITFGYHAEQPNGLADAAEDPDVILHEYGHAVQADILLPGTWNGLDQDAIAEGWADLFAALVLWDDQHPKDAACIGEWFGSYIDPDQDDGAPHCFRRLDNALTYPDVLSMSGHLAGQVLSGLAWDLTARHDGNDTLRIFLEANYLMPLAGGDLRDFAAGVYHATRSFHDEAAGHAAARDIRDRRLDTPYIAELLGVEWIDWRAPRIDTISPTIAWPGTHVDVHGHALVTTPGPAQPRAELGGVEAEVISWSPLGTSLRFVVPELPQGRHGLVVVRSDGLRVPAPHSLAVVPPLEVDLEAPLLTRAGETIHLAGANFTYAGMETTPRVETTRVAAPHLIVPLEIRVHAPDLLEIHIPHDLAEAHATLRVTRGDGVAWSSLDFGINLPHLETRIIKEPDDAPLSTFSPRESPHWVLAVLNTGTDRYAAENHPTMLEILLEQQQPPYGTWHRLVPIENDLAPGEAVEIAVHIDPLCDCPTLIDPLHVPAGEWHGHATLHKDPDQDPLPHGARVALHHTFLVPPTGER